MSISVHVDRCMYVYAYFGLLRTYFNPRLAARAKMSLSRAQNIFTYREVCIDYIAPLVKITAIKAGSQERRKRKRQHNSRLK